MKIVTLTTDLGTRDHYVAVVKGELLTAVPGVQIIDISHEIAPFNIAQGAFVLKNSYVHFPKGTFHLVGIDTQGSEDMSFLVMEHEKQTFIGPDNGIFSLLFEDNLPAKMYRLKTDDSRFTNTLPISSLLINAFKWLANDKKIEEIAEPTRSIRMLLAVRPIINEQYIRASVIYFDRFENAILNVERKDFDKVSKDRSFVLHFHRNDDVRDLSRNYFDGADSDILCFFNSSGHLELAMNHGPIGSLLGLRVGDTVQLTFK